MPSSTAPGDLQQREDLRGGDLNSKVLYCFIVAGKVWLNCGVVSPRVRRLFASFSGFSIAITAGHCNSIC